jgi:hypothetical protein
LDPDADRCELCGVDVNRSDPLSDIGASAFLDTVHLLPTPGEPDDERVVRPALAILYRMAIGPAADYYAPRFLEFERTGRSFPSWNWASLWIPCVWAFYHKLWWPGLAFAMWPVIAMAAFGAVDPYLGDSALASIACAGILLWLLPAVIAALSANSLIYQNTRWLVREAEAKTARPEDAARALGERAPIAPGSASLLGTAAILLASFVVTPALQTAYTDRDVRTQVAEGLAAVAPLKQQVEAGWGPSRPSLIAPNFEVVHSEDGTGLLGAVNVSLDTGRVRLTLPPWIPELAGRSILLAPAIDREERVRWICVPVGIPTRYLPRECRQG